MPLTYHLILMKKAYLSFFFLSLVFSWGTFNSSFAQTPQKQTDSLYHYVDKSGKVLSHLGKWAEAESFDRLGAFALVRDLKGDSHFLQKTGKTYRWAYYANQPVEVLCRDINAGNLDTIFHYPQLKVLIIRKNYCGPPRHSIQPLLAKLSQLKQLEILSLKQQRIGSFLPEDIGQLRHLKYLALSGVTRLPKGIGKLTKLHILDITGNGITNLPTEISQLKQLQQLNLAFSHRLTSLPWTFGQLRNLTKLNLDANQIRVFPQVIGQLAKLRHLTYGSNHLRSFPQTIIRLAQLEELHLAGFMTALPWNIGQLKNLKVLNLTGNRLTALPPQIVQLKNLEILKLENNRLTSLLPSYSNVRLNTFEEVYLKNNQLSVFPKALIPLPGQISMLTEIDLSNNRVKKLPENIDRLQQLTSLNLNNNQLSSLPVAISKLKNLKVLHLENNRFTSLPPHIAQLKNLRILYLKGNAISEAEMDKILLDLLPDCRVKF